MVERLKNAIAKAHAERLTKEAANQGADPSPAGRDRADLSPRPPVASGVASDLWSSIRALEVDQKAMARARAVSLSDDNPARVSFDILRTRLTKLLRENNWSRLAVTSYAKGAGKTFVSLNLALSLARNPDNSVMLFDLDMRAPGLSKVLYTPERLHVDKFLKGEIEPQNYLRRIEDNLLVGLNARSIPNSAELIQSETAKEILDATITAFKPTVVIFDLPPLMVSDDTIGVLDHIDGALLIAAAGETRTKEIAESEQLILEHTNLLGVILNKGEQSDIKKYYY